MIDVEADPDRIAMQLWRGRASTLVILLVAEVSLVMVGAPTRFLLVLTGGLLVCLGICCLGLWLRLYRFANRFGGRWYAISQVGVSLLLTPIVFGGILLVPQLVQSDVQRGFAAWRRATALTVWERALRTLSFLALWGFLKALARHSPQPFEAPLLIAAPFLSAMTVACVVRLRQSSRCAPPRAGGRAHRARTSPPAP